MRSGTGNYLANLVLYPGAACYMIRPFQPSPCNSGFRVQARVLVAVHPPAWHMSTRVGMRTQLCPVGNVGMGECANAPAVGMPDLDRKASCVMFDPAGARAARF